MEIDGNSNSSTSSGSTSNLGILNSMVSRQKNQDKEFLGGSGSFYGGNKETSSGFSSSTFGSYGTSLSSSSATNNPHNYTYSNGQIVQLEWHPYDSRFIFSIVYTTSLSLWNIETGSKIWKTEVGVEPITWMVFNPFDFTHLCVATPSGIIYFLRDIKIDLPSNSANQPISAPTAEHKYTISSNGKASANNNNNDFVAVHFSPITRNIVYFLLSREILIFDLKIHQVKLCM